MPGACRVLMDPVGLGGKVIKGACTVLVNGMPVARVGDLVAPHTPYKGLHKVPSPLIKGVCTVLAEGQPVATQGSFSACRDIVLFGSCDVIVG